MAGPSFVLLPGIPARERRPAGHFKAEAVDRLRREYELVCAFEDRIDVADHLREAGVPVVLYGAGAEALEALDVRQDDLLSGGDPFSGKRLRQDQPDGMEAGDEED